MKRDMTAQRAYRERTKAKVIEYLATHPCVDCGEADVVVLEFDHVRGKKKRTIASMLVQGYSFEKILKEIEKCDVRCANCHRRKTAKAGNWLRAKSAAAN